MVRRDVLFNVVGCCLVMLGNCADVMFKCNAALWHFGLAWCGVNGNAEFWHSSGVVWMVMLNSGSLVVLYEWWWCLSV